MNRIAQYTVLFSAVMFVDRLTKWWALSLAEVAHKTVFPFLSFELAFNRGITWGLFHSNAFMPFILVSCVAMLITAVMVWHAYQPWREGKQIVGQVLVVAGSLSNLIDRALYGGVIDFISLSYGNWQWPLFNIADVAIVVGALFILFSYDQ